MKRQLSLEDKGLAPSHVGMLEKRDSSKGLKVARVFRLALFR